MQNCRAAEKPQSQTNYFNEELGGSPLDALVHAGNDDQSASPELSLAEYGGVFGGALLTATSAGRSTRSLSM
jgi:hypothetical protein